jgi:hypothetical protein
MSKTELAVGQQRTSRCEGDEGEGEGEIVAQRGILVTLSLAVDRVGFMKSREW